MTLRLHKTMANILKKPVNSANINGKSRTRRLNRGLLSGIGISPHMGALWGLRLWSFFSTFAILFLYLYATLGIMQPESPGENWLA
jgi:uncharacterized membrane protein